MTVTRKEFQTLAAEMRPAMLAVARRLLSGDTAAAEDAVQDTLLRLWSMRDRLDDYGSPQALARVMLRNRCIDMLRSPRSSAATLDEACGIADESVPSPHVQLMRRQTIEAAYAAMASMPRGMREVMELRHREGLEVSEIAVRLGQPESSVRVNLSRGRQRLRMMMSAEM